MDENQLQRKLKDAVDDMMRKLEVKIRPIEKQTYLNMANCYNNKNDTTEDIHRCVQMCSGPSSVVNNVMQNEMSQFQDRLQRGSRACEDEVRDKFGDSTDHIAMQKAMNACMSKVVDKNIAMLPTVQSNIEKVLEKMKNN